MKDMRVVITCVTFEVSKVVEPVRYYKADRVHLLSWGKKAPYRDFIREVEQRIRKEGIEIVKSEVMLMDFAQVMRTVRSIIKEENGKGNHVYVNIGAGPQVYSSAAMVACMMEGGTPFNAATKTFTVDSSNFYDGTKPVGIAKEVYDPKEIPVFKVDAPDTDLIKGLSVWRAISDDKRTPRTSEVMQGLCDADLMTDIFADDRRRRISQGALMRYRRNFLEKWESLGWLEKGKRGIYSLTEQGRMMLQIFT